MLKRFEVKVALVTLGAGFACSLIACIFNPTLAVWLTPLAAAFAAAASTYILVRRPINHFLDSKENNHRAYVPDDLAEWCNCLDRIIDVRTHARKEMAQASAPASTINRSAGVGSAASTAGGSTPIASSSAVATVLKAEPSDLDNMLEQIASTIHQAPGVDEALDRVLHLITVAMPDQIFAGCAFKQFGPKDDLLLAASVEIKQEDLKFYQAALKETIFSIVATQSPLIWNMQQVTSMNIPLNPACNCILVAPLKARGKFLGCMMLGAKAVSEPALSKLTGAAKQIADGVSIALLRVAMPDDTTRQPTRDKQTGLPTRLALTKVLHTHSNEMSLLLVEGANFNAFNLSLGREKGDLLIEELAKLVVQSVPADKRLLDGASVFRTGAAQFVVLLAPLDETNLFKAADRIATAVKSYQNWPVPIPGWSVSIAATLSTDASSAIDLMQMSEQTMAFMKEQHVHGRTLFASQLPKQYKRLPAEPLEITGKLEATEPSEQFITMISNGALTGIVQVTNSHNQKFWAFIKEGKLLKAKLGNLRGDLAFFEFFCTFEEGQFEYVEATESMLNGTHEDLRALGQSYDTREVKSLLAEALRHKETFTRARSKLPSVELYAVATIEAQSPEIWTDLRTVPNPPSEPEIAIMAEILKLSVGSLKLKEIFFRLQTYPTPWLWNCAALLLDQGLIRLTAIKNYARA